MPPNQNFTGFCSWSVNEHWYSSHSFENKDSKNPLLGIPVRRTWQVNLFFDRILNGLKIFFCGNKYRSSINYIEKYSLEVRCNFFEIRFQTLIANKHKRFTQIPEEYQEKIIRSPKMVHLNKRRKPF